MRNLIFALVLVSNVPQVGGQPLPAELRKLVEGDRRTVDANNLNDAQRKFLWTDTVRDPKNFLRVEVPNEYVEQVSALFASARGTVSSPSHPQTAVLEFSTQGFPFLSTITEDSFRTHLMFGSTNGPKMMLSVWEFQNAGARITLVEEFLNQKVLQSRATLALAVAQQSKCLWKLNWFDAGGGYEFYVEDKLDATGRPNFEPEFIVERATKLVSGGVWKRFGRNALKE